MSSLPPPWSGLVRIAARVDLWPVVAALGGGAAASGASLRDWAEAGFDLRYLPLLEAPPVPGEWVWPGAAAWPCALDDLPFGPVALAWEGQLGERVGSESPGVAIVGARSCTSFGVGWASRLGMAVAEAGGVVVSGLARGIDAAAHEAARGRTIAVLGQGLDAPMAGWQRRLRGEILRAGGAIVSEFPGATPASVATFPVRNRIVAGLARTVVVVEAARKSGTRSTAAHALRYGRDVLAVPGAPHWPASVGCLDLIEEGAGMIRDEDSVLRAVGLARPGRRAGEGQPAEDPLLLAGRSRLLGVAGPGRFD